MAKPKGRQIQNYTVAGRSQHSAQIERKLSKARQQHAAGVIGADDFVWAVMQCYAAEARSKV